MYVTIHCFSVRQNSEQQGGSIFNTDHLRAIENRKVKIRNDEIATVLTVWQRQGECCSERPERPMPDSALEKFENQISKLWFILLYG